MSSNRISKVISSLEKEGLEVLLATTPTNLRYLCGYTGTNGIALISPQEKIFITDFRYKDQVRQEIKNFKTIIGERDIFTELSNLKFLKKKNLKLGFEGNAVTYQLYQKLKALLPEILLVSTENLVEKISAKKEKSEIQKLKKQWRLQIKFSKRFWDLLNPEWSKKI